MLQVLQTVTLGLYYFSNYVLGKRMCHFSKTKKQGEILFLQASTVELTQVFVAERTQCEMLPAVVYGP